MTYDYPSEVYSISDNGQVSAGPQWNQMAANAWAERQEKLRNSADDYDWTKQYRPKPIRPVGMTTLMDGGRTSYFIGGQDVTDDLQREFDQQYSMPYAPNEMASMKGDTTSALTMEQLANRRLSNARKQAALTFVNRLTGNEPASMDTIMPLMRDPMAQQLEAPELSELVQRTYGRPMGDFLRAGQMQRAYGRPMTWAEIADIDAREKGQSKEFAWLNALQSGLGARGQLGQIISAPYDAQRNGVPFKPDETSEEVVLPITQEQHDEIKRRFNQAFFRRYSEQGQETPESIKRTYESGQITFEEAEAKLRKHGFD